MAGKDVLEKKLLDYADVFADIWNVLVFGGRPVIAEAGLADALPRSIFPAGAIALRKEDSLSSVARRGPAYQ